MLKKTAPSDGLSLPYIGVVHSPFAQKFAVPRQSGLAPDAVSEIEFFPPYGDPQAFIGLEGFSHLHLIFHFHQVPPGPFRAMVRPPRLGGNRRAGVFATRSPFRPSRLGLSVVKLERIFTKDGLTRLEVSGADLVDGTPLIDIKPYIPFVDAIEDAVGGFAAQPPNLKRVEFLPECEAKLAHLSERELLALKEVLAQDPRPAYKERAADDRVYYALISGLNIGFKVQDDVVRVVEVK